MAAGQRCARPTAGGIEKCVPTVRGTPDHGDAWSRPWHETGVDCPDFTLRRVIGSQDGAPYRSIGVEPVLGRTFDRDDTTTRPVAVVPASGTVRWRLTLTAFVEGQA